MHATILDPCESETLANFVWLTDPADDQLENDSEPLRPETVGKRGGAIAILVSVDCLIHSHGSSPFCLVVRE